MLPQAASSLDTSELAGVIVVGLLSLSWHEAAHALVADRLGDPTARQLGRVTLNPLKHLDPFLSFILPGLLWYLHAPIVGGGKPVPINVLNFRHRARDFMLVALAGPGANVLLAVLFAAAYVGCAWSGVLDTELANPYGRPHVLAPTFIPLFAWDPQHPLEFWLEVGVLGNIALAAFNLLPIPPLDGSRVIGWLLPQRLQVRWYALDRLGFLILIMGLLVFGGIDYLWTGIVWIWQFVGLRLDELIALVPPG